MSSGYKALAAAVVRASVEDLEVVYKKVRHWDKLDKQGKLKEYVEEEVEKQASRVAKNYERITITLDDKTAVDFFKDDSKIGDMFCSIIDIDIDGLPREVVRQRDFVRENASQLEAKIRAFRSWAQRKIKDEQILE